MNANSGLLLKLAMAVLLVASPNPRGVNAEEKAKTTERPQSADKGKKKTKAAPKKPPAPPPPPETPSIRTTTAQPDWTPSPTPPPPPAPAPQPVSVAGAADTPAGQPESAATRNVLFVQAHGGGSLALNTLGPGPAVRLGVGWAPPILDGRLAVTVDLSYGQSSSSGSGSDLRLGLEGAEYQYSLLQQELRLFAGPVLTAYRTDGGASLYFAAGVDVHMVSTTVRGESSSGGFGETRETSTQPGIGARAGGSLPLGPGFASAELAFSWANLGHTATGPSHLSSVALFVGYGLGFAL